MQSILNHAYARVSKFTTIVLFLSAYSNTYVCCKDAPFPRQNNLCIVEKMNFLLRNNGIVNENTQSLECHTLDGSDVFEIDFRSQSSIKFKEMLSKNRGGLYMVYDQSWIDVAERIIRVPENETLEFVTHDHVMKLSRAHAVDSHSNLRKPFHSHEENREWLPYPTISRYLQREVTDKNRNVMLVARASTDDSANNKSIDYISDSIFGSHGSFKAQMNSCSFGKIDVSPYLEHQSVIDIHLSINISDHTYGSFFEKAEAKINEYLNMTAASKTNKNILHTIAEFVVVVSPNGLKPPPGMPSGYEVIAGSQQNSYKTVIVDSWVNETMALIHEIGHCMNIGHAYEDDNLYADTSSVMGAVFRDIYSNCYNGAAYSQLGWISDKITTINLETFQASDKSSTYDLAFFGDYPVATTNQPTVIQILNFYIYYNMKIGINSDTKEYADNVIIHEFRIPNDPGAGTNLVAALTPKDGLYENTALNFAIELCSYNNASHVNASIANTVTLGIGLIGESLCN